jgi:hypothetical protein
MFDMKVGAILSPMVKTSDFGGLSTEDLTELCVDRILSVADSAPPEIREQARLFRNSLEKTIYEYLKRARAAERANCIQLCLKGGQDDAASLLRRT